MGLFTWTWTEEIIDWCHQDSPGPQKCRQWRGSDKTHDQRGLQLWEHALCVCWLSWHYSKYSLLWKILRTSLVSCTALYLTTLSVVTICCVPWQCSVIWPIQCFDGIRKFRNIHYSHWIYAHVTISFRKWKNYHIASASGWQMVIWVQSMR